MSWLRTCKEGKISKLEEVSETRNVTVNLMIRTYDNNEMKINIFSTRATGQLESILSHICCFKKTITIVSFQYQNLSEYYQAMNVIVVILAFSVLI